MTDEGKSVIFHAMLNSPRHSLEIVKVFVFTVFFGRRCAVFEEELIRVVLQGFLLHTAYRGRKFSGIKRSFSYAILALKLG